MLIDYWETTNGDVPVLDFISKQSIPARKKIQWVIDFFEIKGLSLLGTSDFLIKLKGYDLYELRVRVAKVWYRIMVVIKGAKSWLVHAFKKSTSRTPSNEIEIGLHRKAILESGLAIA